MKSSRSRWVVLAFAAACTAAALAVVTSEAPAGNRTPTVQLLGFPGPGEVTYGQNVAYTSTVVNTESSNYTHVIFRNPIPTTVANGETLKAVFKYASCPGTLTPTEFVCNELSQVRVGETAKVTIVWQTPAAGSSSNCPSSMPVCMTNTAAWTIKEGTGSPGSSGPDTFFTGTVATSLLVVPDQKKAGGYALDACTSLASPTLSTNPSLGAGNPLATNVCATSLPVGDPFNPGHTVKIDERDRTPSDPGLTQVSEICIPVPGDSCTNPAFVPFVFTPLAKFSWTIANSSLPKGEKIDLVFHNGVPVSFDLTADPRVVGITVDNKTKTTTVVAESSTNGSWTFG
jgi:hypothetical protein